MAPAFSGIVDASTGAPTSTGFRRMISGRELRQGGVCVPVCQGGCLGDTSVRVSFSLPPSLSLSAPDWRSGGMSSGGSPVQSQHRGLQERYQTADGKLTL